MKREFTIRPLLLASLLSCALLPAHGSPAAQSCTHVHADVGADLDALPPAKLLVGVGTSVLPVTTSSAMAQRFVDQGVSLLHAFWFVEAYRAFREAARLDPDCAMAHWGMAKALEHSAAWSELRAASVEKAQALAEKAPERERHYIAALAASERGEGKGAVRELEALVARYPAEVEARLFLALELMDGYDAEAHPRGRHAESLALLRDLLRDAPRHPAVHHYRIHAIENGPDPASALDSATLLPSLAPNAGHMIHMAGHVHYRLGDHERAIAIFSRAAAADERFATDEKIAPALNWNYAHNLRYLIAACAAAGRYEEAKRWAAKLPAGGDTPERLSGMIMVAHPADAHFDLALRLGLWPRAVELAAGSNSAYAKSMTHYAAGMAALDAADLSRAETATQALEAAAWRLSTSDDADAADLLTLVTIAALELRGRLLVVSPETAGGNAAAGIRLLLRAHQRERELRNYDPPPYAHPTAVTLANAYAATNQLDLAAETLEDFVRDDPSRTAPALLALAQVHHARKDAEQTANALRRFHATWKLADRDLPQFAIADRFRR